jgi:hypothetical protein
MGRKTIDVQEMKEYANDLLARRGNTMTKEDVNIRLGVTLMIERILMDSGNYKGYRYLCSDDLEEGVSPGIIYTEDSHEIVDDTRRRYF